MRLSILLPGIRAGNWPAFLASIDTNHEWELIIVSPPVHLPPQLFGCDRLSLATDFGSPMRASCIAALLACGKYIVWAADDGVFIPGTLDRAIALLDESPNEKRVIVTKYLEACTQVHPDSYYLLNNAYPLEDNGPPLERGVKSPYIDDQWLIFNAAVMHRNYYNYLGGWDCRFESTAYGHADLAVRAQRDGCEAILIQDALLNCSHMPDRTGDHGPVYDAQIWHDRGLYKEIYGSPDCLNRTKIDLDNWRRAPRKWARRFG